MTDHNPFLWSTAERQGRAHSFDMINLTLELRDRIEALEEAENERRFREGCKLVDEATPEQIRTAVDPASTLAERLAQTIAGPYDDAELWILDARAAIREVAAWIKRRQEDDYGVVIPDVREVIDWLEREAER